MSGGPNLCANGGYDIYTKVFSYLKFIKKIIGNKGVQNDKVFFKRTTKKFLPYYYYYK